METLTAAARQVFACGRVGSELSIVWHAGEPLVLPPEYFREAFAIIDQQRPSGIQIRHSFQTNGILLTDRWVRFIQVASMARRGCTMPTARHAPEKELTQWR